MVHKLLIPLLLLASTAFAGDLTFSNKPRADPTPAVVQKKADSNVVALTRHNLVVLRNEINGTSVAETITALNNLKVDEPVLFIMSGGGSVYAGTTLIKYIQDSKKPITCIADVAASMAFAIFQSCHKRLALDMSMLMQHQASWGVEGQTENNQSYIDFLNTYLGTVEKAEAKRIGITHEQFKAKILSDWWIVGVDSVKEGVADGIAIVECDQQLTLETSKQTLMTMFGEVTLEYSGCPLARSPLKITFAEYNVSVKDRKAIWDVLGMNDQSSIFKAVKMFFRL